MSVASKITGKPGTFSRAVEKILSRAVTYNAGRYELLVPPDELRFLITQAAQDLIVNKLIERIK